MTSNHGQQNDLLYNMPHHVSTEIFTNIMRVTALATFRFVRGQVFCVLARPNPSFSMRRHFPDGDNHYNADFVVTSMSPWKGTLLRSNRSRSRWVGLGSFLTLSRAANWSALAGAYFSGQLGLFLAGWDPHHLHGIWLSESDMQGLGSHCRSTRKKTGWRRPIHQ